MLETTVHLAHFGFRRPRHVASKVAAKESILRAALLAALLVPSGAASAAIETGSVATEYTVVVEREASLPSHTIFRPVAEADTARIWPVLVWENGGCSGDPTRYAAFLTRIAAAGNFVIAKGFEGNTASGPPRDIRAREADVAMEAAISWAAIEAARHDGKYFQRINASQVGLMGHSCGGFTALQVAAVDPRVKLSLPLPDVSLGC